MLSGVDEEGWAQGCKAAAALPSREYDSGLAGFGRFDGGDIRFLCVSEEQEVLCEVHDGVDGGERREGGECLCFAYGGAT